MKNFIWKVTITILLMLVLMMTLSFSFGENKHVSNIDSHAFPRTLASYDDSELTNLGEIIIHRIKDEPFNLIATIIFFLAILHTMMTSYFRRLSFEAEDRYNILKKSGMVDKESQSIASGIYHLLSEVEVVFGFWSIALGITISIYYDWSTFTTYINSLHYTEPLFIIVVMTIASSRPILKFFEELLWQIVKIFGGSLQAWWLAIIISAPLLGSLITEPAAMTIAAYVLAEKVYSLGPSTKMKYATLSLLFVNISVGGVLTNFAAPPILMVAGTWNWSSSYMFMNFGWKAIIAIILSSFIYFLLCQKDMNLMKDSFESYEFKLRIQNKFISQKELEENFDELSLLVCKNTKFESELNAYSSILKERIKELAVTKLSNEEAASLDIENAIDEKFETIHLREKQRVIPGLLPEEVRPQYHDPNWDNRTDKVPLWIMIVHIGFLVWAVVNAHTAALFLGGFLFYLGFIQVTAFYQNRLDLKPALLVAFFISGLIIHGTLQGWWIAPILGSLPNFALNISAIVLTAFNDNAAITYLSTLVPNFSESLKYSLVAGAVTGGGLTVIANAPNPVGQSILKKYFKSGISSLQILKYALIPTVITALCLNLL